MKFVLRSVVLEGNTVFSSEEIQAAIASDIGRETDFGGLRAIVNKVSRYYRDRGYAFARAALPAQDIVGGVVRVLVLEGRYGQIQAVLDGKPTDIAAPYLARLRPGDVIATGPLERASLLLTELPGYEAVPVVRPSDVVGAGDLEIVLKESPQYTGSVRLDNHGGDVTGANRVLASVSRFRNVLPGDQLQFDALVTGGGTDLITVQYSLPLGGQGWRGSAALSHSTYKLSDVQNFQDGEFRGSSDVLTLGVTYPVIRDRRTSLTFHAGLAMGHYKNIRPAADTERYASMSVPVALRFSQLDDLGGGGTTFGSATLTAGRISERANYLSPATIGSFFKQSLDVVRLQRLGERFTGYVRLAAQRSGDALDSSERMSAGGANGVRAFPSGEGSADRGVLAQMELRYQSPVAGLQPYVFFDTADMTRIDAEAGNSDRGLSGRGVGVRWQYQRLSADIAAAWAGHTGLTAEQTALLKKPRFWANLNYAF